MLVLVVVVILGMVVLALAKYSGTSLRYGQAVEAKGDRFAAADGAMRDAIERLRMGAAPAAVQCPTNAGGPITRPFPIDINGATTSVSCQLSGTGASAISQWAVILTGNGVGSERILSAGGGGGSMNNPKRISGPVYINDTRVGASAPNDGPFDPPFDLNAKVSVVDGDVYFPGTTCSEQGDRLTIDRFNGAPNPPNVRFEVTPAPRSGVCVQSSTITNGSPKAAPDIPDLSGLNPTPDTDGDDTSYPDCRVFSPGHYTSLTLLDGRSSYFKSGNYVFDNVVLDIDKQGANQPVVTFGYPDLANGITGPEIPNPGCQPAIVDDAPSSGGIPGATVYLTGTARIDVSNGSLEMLPRHQGGFNWVSVQTLPGSTLGAGSSAQPALATAGGAGQEAWIRGWFWAPDAWINFANVTGPDADVRLNGGAALARLHLGANATAGSFEVSTGTTPARSQYVLTSIAIKDGTTRIVAVVDYANNPSRVAVRSWRVDNV